MTENEAKQWLKHTRAYQHKCDNCEYIDIKGACNEECKDFYDMAIKALEKQVPKKPTYAGKFGDLYVGSCSVCNDGVNSRMNYCDKCGQKLDWEGGE